MDSFAFGRRNSLLDLEEQSHQHVYVIVVFLHPETQR